MDDGGTRDVDKIDVAYVAHLARLALSEQEREVFQGQLEDVVGYVRQIGKLDLEGVEPMSHAVAVRNVFREDVVRESLDHDAVLENAPSAAHGLFVVPKIMEE